MIGTYIFDRRKLFGFVDIFSPKFVDAYEEMSFIGQLPLDILSIEDVF